MQVCIERVRNADFVRRRIEISLVILSHGTQLVLNALAQLFDGGQLLQTAPVLPIDLQQRFHTGRIHVGPFGLEERVPAQDPIAGLRRWFAVLLH